MPSFWSSTRAWIQDHLSLLNIFASCFPGRSDLGIHIYKINYAEKYILIWDNNADRTKSVQLDQLQMMDLEDYCEKHEPPKRRPSDHAGSYDTNTFPKNWTELLEFHWAKWDQRKTSAAEPRQVDHPPLAYPPGDPVTRTGTEPVDEGSKSSIDFSLYEQGLMQ